MSTAFTRAPHIQGSERHRLPTEAPNAALLVDFDNVTMGMRSDLSKELKSLLNSDIIKGKVTVQRAYADWRRYPQYIVPLSEASIDLIFAPAYGSSKKNATDIRMAIDGMELVFTRPEIGTYILLTGDSDFSSLVLKLKEYGKYVIGVGIQESSSDILVQNCDEYYSYTSISGLRKSTDAAPSAGDPWVLVEKALDRMASRKDVMRSDRLKQVMLELDSAFDEKGLGFSKFSRFLTEAAQKGILQLRKLENGQYEIQRSGGGASPSRAPSGRSREKESSGRKAAQPPRTRATPAPSGDDGAPGVGKAALEPAWDLLLRALDDLMQDQDEDSVRDSDVKRRMLALDSGFDEAELGFGKFSLFLRQAHDQEVITLRKGDEGNYHVSPSAGSAKPAAGKPEVESKKSVPSPTPTASRRDEPEVRRLRPRTAGSRSRGGDEPPPILEGQAVGGSTAPKRADGPAKGPAVSPGEVFDPEALRLPTDRAAVIKYLSNSYGGVGEKTAETLVDTLGADLFKVLQTRPSRVEELLPPARAEKVLEGWNADFARRKERYLKERGGRPGRGQGGREPRSRTTPDAGSVGASRPQERRGEPVGSPTGSASPAPTPPSSPEPELDLELAPVTAEVPKEEPKEQSKDDPEEAPSSLGGIASLLFGRGRRTRGGSGSD